MSNVNLSDAEALVKLKMEDPKKYKETMKNLKEVLKDLTQMAKEIQTEIFS